MIKIIFFYFFGFSFLYLGIGGVIYLELVQEKEKIELIPILKNGSTFRVGEVEASSKQMADLLEQLRLSQIIFPLSEHLPSFLNYIITAFSFGAFGAFGNQINTTLKNGTSLGNTKNLFLYLTNGAISGVIVLAISYTIPFVLSSNETTLKPTSVVFFCLFSGFLHSRFFEWFDSIFKKNIFKAKN